VCNRRPTAAPCVFAVRCENSRLLCDAGYRRAAAWRKRKMRPRRPVVDGRINNRRDAADAGFADQRDDAGRRTQRALRRINNNGKKWRRIAHTRERTADGRARVPNATDSGVASEGGGKANRNRRTNATHGHSETDNRRHRRQLRTATGDRCQRKTLNSKQNAAGKSTMQHLHCGVAAALTDARRPTRAHARTHTRTEAENNHQRPVATGRPTRRQMNNKMKPTTTNS
jgi:hypothetical protein